MDTSSLPPINDPLSILDAKLPTLLFDRIPMGIAVFDAQFWLLRSNLTWDSCLECDNNTPAGRAVPGKTIFELFPGNEALFKTVHQQVMRGETARSNHIRTVSCGILSYWDSVFTPVVEQGQFVAILSVMTEITERALAEQRYQAAFERLKDNEATLRSLVENAQHFAVYRIAVDRQDPMGGNLIFVSPSIQEIVGGSTAEDFTNWFQNLHPDDAERVYAANRRSVEKGEPYNEIVRVYHTGKQQWVWVHTISNPFFDDAGNITHFDGMVIDITDQMQLREVERLRQAAEGLRDILEMINSNHPIQDVLDYIAFHANQLLGSSSTMIRQVFLEDDTVRTVASCNLPTDFESIRVTPFYLGASDQTLLSNKPVVLEDVRAVYPPRLENAEGLDDQQRAGLEATVKYYRSLLKIPLFVKNTIYGALTLHFEQPRKFSEEDLRLAKTLAGQAALAIENARLIDQEKEQAVVEERSRLARELHDAVTQTLFSTTLTAEVLPRIWERNPAEGRKKLEELRELTRGALAEMRTLLMELRPDAMAEAELKDLLRHLTNAFIARARIPVQLILDGDPLLPLDVKIALYRIAQEALNNIMKYSEADQVIVSLVAQVQESMQQVDLMVTDNGLGFDPERVISAGHFGLRIMQERAEKVGAQLQITSQPSEGTCIRVLWHGPSRIDPYNKES